MKDQLKTIREALVLGIKAINHLGGAREAMPLHDALPALAQLEAMVGEQKPVHWRAVLDPEQAPQQLKTTMHVVGFREKKAAEGFVAEQIDFYGWRYTIEPLCAAPVAQQPQGEPLKADVERTCPFCNEEWVEQPQARPDFADEWTGYLKDGETPFERFLRERKDMQSVLKLYQRVLEENERLKAQQPQAEPFGYVSQHTNGSWEFSPTAAGVYPDTAKSITAVYTKQPQAEAVPLPERDATKTAEQQGLFRKFVVRRTDGSDAPGGKHDGCDYFVLDVTHDTHAKAALAAYAESVEETHPQLAADMRNRYKLAAPQQAEAVPSDVMRDAERYRWLRNESWAGYNTGKGTPSVYTVDGAGNRRTMLAEEAMDDAIDAAIAQQKGVGHG